MIESKAPFKGILSSMTLLHLTVDVDYYWPHGPYTLGQGLFLDKRITRYRQMMRRHTSPPYMCSGYAGENNYNNSSVRLDHLLTAPTTITPLRYHTSLRQSIRPPRNHVPTGPRHTSEANQRARQEHVMSMVST